MADMQYEILKRTRLQNSRPHEIYVRKRDTIKYSTVTATCTSELEQCLNVIPKSIWAKHKTTSDKQEPENKTFSRSQTRPNKVKSNIRTLSPRYIADGQSGDVSERSIDRTRNTRQTGQWKVSFGDRENITRHRMLVQKHTNVSTIRTAQKSTGMTVKVPVNQGGSKRLSYKDTDTDLTKHKVSPPEARYVTTPAVETLPTAGKCRENSRKTIPTNLTAAFFHKEPSAAKTNNNNEVYTPRPTLSRFRCKTSMGFPTVPEPRTARTAKSAGFLRYRQCTDAEGSILTESSIGNLATQLETFVTLNNIYKFQSVFLSCDPDTKQKVVNFKANSGNSSSLFFRACQLSRITFVRLMLDECDVNIEQTGNFHVPDGGDDAICQVTPLWQAAASSNLDLVRLLTSFGANINATSSTGCTVVRAACCVASVSIVSFLIAQGADIHVLNQHGVTCLMNAVTSTEITKLLIHHGSKISQTDIQGNTVLHYATETGRLDTVKLLVEMGANPMKSNNDSCNAIQCAAMNGHRDVVDYLLRAATPNLEEIVDTFLLLGSVCIIMDTDYCQGCLDWHKAFELKRICNKASRTQFRTSFFGDSLCPSVLTDIVAIKEIISFDELPTNYYDHDTLCLQALLIYERIRGSLDNNFLNLLMYRGAVSADQKNFKLAINLWKTAYKLRLHKFMNKSGNSDGLDMFNNSLMNTLRLLVKIAHEMCQEQFNIIPDSCTKQEIFVSEHIIRDLFKMACHHVFQASEALKQNKNQNSRLHGSFTYLLKACLSICYVYLNICPAETHNPEVMTQLQQLIRLNPRGVNNETLLHLCLDYQLLPPYNLDSKKLSPMKQPSFVLMEILLLLGADPLAQDAGGNTVLHQAARLHRQGRTLDQSQTRMLLRLGVHADQVNHQVETALHLIAPVDDLRKILQQTALKCLAARAIVLHRIPYIGEIPKSLYSFIELHTI